ncbi:MAG: hypothetical protein K2Q09_10700 [Phycisphaerales bacterium]|nr:hypothetical protein [Chloroflexota bacterium]MBY0309200.1 hypothetical protein [Phycisphaerales bacterium]
MSSTSGKVRKNESMGFVDAVMADLGGPRSSLLLERLDAATPWEELAAPIRALPEYNNPGAGHPPSYAATPPRPGPLAGRSQGNRN